MNREPCHGRRAIHRAKIEARIARVVWLGQVHKNGATGFISHCIITRPGIGPYALLHRRADHDVVIALKRIDDDRQKIAFARQERSQTREVNNVH